MFPASVQNWTLPPRLQCVGSTPPSALWYCTEASTIFHAPRQLDEFGLVSFVPLDVTNEDSIGLLMQRVDHVTQFGEDADVAVQRTILMFFLFFFSRRTVFIPLDRWCVGASRLGAGRTNWWRALRGVELRCARVGPK